MRKRRILVTTGICVVVAGLVTAAELLERRPARATTATPTPAPSPVVPAPAVEAPAAAKPAAFTMPECQTEGAPAETHEVGNPAARRAAQKGLDFLAREARAWQQNHNCYGCHVQAVTAEAFSVGVANQYRVKDADFKFVLRGMTSLSGGAHRPGGIGYEGGPEIARTAKVLGAAAFARVDEKGGRSMKNELLKEARILLGRQHRNGAVPLPYTQPPVLTSSTQGTALAIITWKQAYERTADDQWLTAIQRGEDYLAGVVERWKRPPADLQELNWAVMGLLAAGVGSGEGLLVDLGQKLAQRQNRDGGWALRSGGGSEAFATGQALYTLRLLGLTDRDEVVARGTRWLLKKQAADGGWSHQGFGKAEAMWGVLGLVSIDVLTVAVAGLREGERLDQTAQLSIIARDNSGGRVTKVELAIDDLPAAGACAPILPYALDPRALPPGRHVADVRVTNAKGEMSRRRLEFYTGNVALTQIGTRWEGGATAISLRNVSPAGEHGTVSLEVVGPDGKTVDTQSQEAKQGAMRFAFRGAEGRYTARLTYQDAAAKIVHTEEVPLVHDTPERQQAGYSQVKGTLALPSGAAAENVEVELLDDAGKVVAKTRSTRSGEYRFRNVEADKKYKLRVNKVGYEAAPAAVAPARADEAEVNMSLQAH
jgi:squalene-hopene/tetraprenyl-beta-curcumene cyclase